MGSKNENIISYAGSTLTPPVSSQPFSYLVIAFELGWCNMLWKYTKGTPSGVERCPLGLAKHILIPTFILWFFGSKRRAGPAHTL